MKIYCIATVITQIISSMVMWLWLRLRHYLHLRRSLHHLDACFFLQLHPLDLLRQLQPTILLTAIATNVQSLVLFIDKYVN